MTIEEILTEYPHLEVEDIQAALAYGAEMARERYVEIPVEAIGWNLSLMKILGQELKGFFKKPGMTWKLSGVKNYKDVMIILFEYFSWQ